MEKKRSAQMATIWILSMMFSIVSAQTPTTNPNLPDTDNDGFWDGPDRLIELNGTLFIKIGEDKNGNGKYDPAGYDGRLGTSDDEFDPNNPASFPEGGALLPYKTAAYTHDFDHDGIPDALEDTNLDGNLDVNEHETNFNTPYFNDAQCHIYFQDATHGWFSVDYSITVLNDNSSISNTNFSNEKIANIYWHIDGDDYEIETAYVEFVYDDVDIFVGTSDELIEDQLVLIFSESLLGPWKKIAVEFNSNPESNRLSASIDKFGYFAIAEEPIPTGVTSIEVGPTQTFTCIQDALDAISPGGTVTVDPGYYKERLVFPRWVDNERGIKLQSADPSDFELVEATIIDGEYEGSVIQFYGDETSLTSIEGFTICHGNNRFRVGGGGISAQGATVVIARNRILYNRSTGCGGGISDCDGIIHHNAIAFNEVSPNLRFESHGGGLVFCDGEISFNTIYGNVSYSSGGRQPNKMHYVNSGAGGISQCKSDLIQNCILWHNRALNSEEAQISSDSTQPQQCCIQNWSGGGDNVSADPEFQNPLIARFSVKEGSIQFGGGSEGSSVGSDGVYQSRLPYSVNSYLTLSETKHEEHSEILLDWSSYPEGSVDAFYIYRSPSYFDGYLRIGKVPGTVKQYADTLPLSTSGQTYIVVAQKLNNSAPPQLSQADKDRKRKVTVEGCAILMANPKPASFTDVPDNQLLVDEMRFCASNFRYAACVIPDQQLYPGLQNDPGIIPAATSGDDIVEILFNGPWRTANPPIYPIKKLYITGHATAWGLMGLNYHFNFPLYYDWVEESRWGFDDWIDNKGLYYPLCNRLGVNPSTNARTDILNEVSVMPDELFLQKEACLLVKYDPLLSAPATLPGLPNPGLAFNEYYVNNPDPIFDSDTIVVLIACDLGRNQPLNQWDNPLHFQFKEGGRNGALDIPPVDDETTFGHWVTPSDWRETSPELLWNTTDPSISPNITRMENPDGLSFAQALSAGCNVTVIASSGLVAEFPPKAPVGRLKLAIQQEGRAKIKANGWENWRWRHEIYSRWNEIKLDAPRKWRVFVGGVEMFGFESSPNNTPGPNSLHDGSTYKYFSHVTQRHRQLIDVFSILNDNVSSIW
jgi:hypothetical protein